MPTAYWGKRAGGFYDASVLKGTTLPQGWVIRIKRLGKSSNNSQVKVRHITYALVQNARAFGFINGQRLGGKANARTKPIP